MEKFDQWIMDALTQTRKSIRNRNKDEENLDVIIKRIRKIQSEDSRGKKF